MGARYVVQRRERGRRRAMGLQPLPHGCRREQRGIGERLAGAELYTREPQRVAELQARYAQIDDELEQALQRWEALESLRQ